jgi:photosystem II stability/assembly factor-like uncharacterized protein
MRTKVLLLALLLAGTGSAAQRRPFQDVKPLDPTDRPPPPVFERIWAGQFLSAYVLDRTHAWVGRDGGGILWTDDSGATWSESKVPRQVRESITGIHFLADATSGWAVNLDGYVLRSSDGGASWSIAARLPGTARAIHFIDASHGWAVGDGLFQYTVDGGGDWQDVALPGGNFHLRAVEFAVDQTSGGFVGIAVGYDDDGIFDPDDPDRGVVLRGTDADMGQEWELVHSLYWPDLESPCSARPIYGSLSNETFFELNDCDFFGRQMQGSDPFGAIVVGTAGRCGFVLRLDEVADTAPLSEEFHVCNSQQNGCPPGHCSCRPPDCPEGNCLPLIRRHPKGFSRIFGVAVDEDGNAILADYEAGFFKRVDPCGPRWAPRGFRDPTTLQPLKLQWSTAPVRGISLNKNDATQIFAVAAGHYSFFSSNGTDANCWITRGGREQWRLDDVLMSHADPDKFTVIGQWYRIATSTLQRVGGVLQFDSVRQSPKASGYLNGICLSPDDAAGVAVGDSLSPKKMQSQRVPGVFYLSSSNPDEWEQVNTQNRNIFPTQEVDGATLHDAAWIAPSGSSGQFWTVGGGGEIGAFVARTTDGQGASWDFVSLASDPPVDLEDVVLRSIACPFVYPEPKEGPTQLDAAMVVGYAVENGSRDARAYWITGLSGATPQLVEIASIPSDAEELLSVAALEVGGALRIYAVGTRAVGQERLGVLYQVEDESGFGPDAAFTSVAEGIIRQECYDQFSEVEASLEGILNDVEIVGEPEGFQVFCVGRCGQILWSKNGGKWSVAQSGTSLPLYGVTARHYPDADPPGVYAYAAGQHGVGCIVGLVPQEGM